jgi:hypothetical protein
MVGMGLDCRIRSGHWFGIGGTPFNTTQDQYRRYCESIIVAEIGILKEKHYTVRSVLPSPSSGKLWCRVYTIDSPQ